jgi:hypothetical protein
MNEQDFLREQVKKIKWQENISYKTIAEDLLEMDYHAFINWLHCRCNLGREKRIKLNDYISCFMD